MLSGSGILAIITGLITGKLSALWLGPEGIGFLGAVRSTTVLGSLILGLGMSTAVTRIGSKLLSEKRDAFLGAVVAVAMATVLATLAVATIIAVRVGPKMGWLLYRENYAAHPLVLVWVLLSIAGNLIGGIEAGILRAYQTYIKTIAGASLLNVLVTFVFSLMALSTHQVGWMLPVFAAASLSHALVLAVIVYRRRLIALPPATKEAWCNAAHALYRIGGAYTASMLVGTGVQSLLPILILRWAGTINLGYYIAATTIASQYLSFITSAMSQDYLPRLSADLQSARVPQIVVEQLQLILLIVLPMVALVLVLAPIVIPIVYTSSFNTTVTLVQWMAAADIFRFGGWSITFALMATQSGRYFFALELFGGVTSLVCAWAGFHLGGMAGLGWAYFFEYVIFSIVAFVSGKRLLSLQWSRFPKKTIYYSLTTVILLRALSLRPEGPFTITIMAIVVAVAMATSYRGLAHYWNLRPATAPNAS
jgi:PST family polysaccharide transporter